MSYNPIKGLHIFGGMNRGGAETLIMNVYRNIDREKFHFDCAVSTMKKCDYDDEILSLMGSIYHLSYKGGRDLRIYYNNLNQLLRSNKYDVIHSHIYYFSGVTLLIGRISKVPIRIAHSHNIKDVPLIIHIGRFSKQKNHVFLIEVFSEFLKECSNAHLVLVGDGPLKDEIVHLAVEKGIESNIHFLGVRSDISEILSAGDIFCFHLCTKEYH